MYIIGVTGLPSSGKGTFSKVASEFGFTEVIMGDVIRSQLRERNLKINRENSNKIMVDLRSERGENVIAKITTKTIQLKIEQGYNRILIDGIRSMAEVEHFKTIFPTLKVIGIHADPNCRFQRSKARRRKDDAYSRKEFDERDRVELGVGIGNIIALSDILISTSTRKIPPRPVLKRIWAKFRSWRRDHPSAQLQQTKAIFREVLVEITKQLEIGVVNG